MDMVFLNPFLLAGAGAIAWLITEFFSTLDNFLERKKYGNKRNF